MKIELKTPAKINLALRVLRKREDGFHDLETIFQMVSLYDRMEFVPTRAEVTLKCGKPGIPEGEANLVMQAARLLQTRYPDKTNQGVLIRLEKNIPFGAGLAGGSGNAAGTLIALNRFWNLGLKKVDLLQLAAKLGSDVPFFLMSPIAFGQGRGDQLTPLRAMEKFHVVIIYPNISIPTNWVYSCLNLKLTKNEKNISILRKFLSLSDISQLGVFLENNLEPIVFQRYPEILELKEELRGSGARGVLMSGSGSAVFGIFTDSVVAEKAQEALQKNDNRTVFLTHTVEQFSEFLPEMLII
tara:strand:- start:1082 stop:1978 length:897 start_codon:yes stop_codon:yes gene_type:complete